MRSNCALPILVITLASMPLCGCVSDETVSRLLAAPDKYMLYNCAELAKEAQGNADRLRELEALKGGGRCQRAAYRQHGLRA